MKNAKLLYIVLFLGVLSFFISACNTKQTNLDPKRPVLLKLMTYYNDKQLEELKKKVVLFNESKGLEKGIIVDVVSTGNVQKINEELIKSANNVAGSVEFPDIFMAYKGIIPYLKGKKEVVDYNEYFSKEELSNYNQVLLDIGRIGKDKKLLMLPIASATDIMYVNKTDFEMLKYSIGVSYSDLETYEGIVKAAEKYYKYTDNLTKTPNDGKSLFGMDSIEEHIFSMCNAMGKDLIVEEDGEIKVSFDHEVARKIWDIYYVPHIKGYFAKRGKYVSEDIMTGKNLVMLGLTSSSPYMPNKIMESDGYIRNIEIAVLKYPYLKDYKKNSLQQGGGIFISKTLPLREIAAAEFIKWFTDKENNLDFAINSSYMPIRKDNTDMDYITSEAKKKYAKELTVDAIVLSLQKKQETYSYIAPDIDIYESLRLVIGRLFSQDVYEKRAMLLKEVESGKNYNEVLDKYLSDKEFEQWRNKIIMEIKKEIRYQL